ncbi:hypothetical protein [Acidovorax sp. Root402]|uniref:hypothetical protein n=1 Tax=Acidovorax sp. Root402 TaxID=1736527 RepID=UPI0007015941|nr:hypothetical protein [Acidovorax sp. Root402]KQW25571.1 hypothetical protein ASC83_05185 [Acidovorax sp. Root402]
MPALQILLPEISAPEAANDCSPAVVPLAAVVVAHPVMDGEGCTGNEKRKGRRPVHASAAARKAAYRAEKARVDFTDKPEIIAKLRETAAQLDCSVNELLQSMVRFAECNRNWKQVGLYGARRDGVLQ